MSVIGKKHLERVFTLLSMSRIRSLLEIRDVTKKIETLWTRLKLACIEVAKVRTSCMAEFVPGSPESENILGIKTISFNFEKRRRVCATFWILTEKCDRLQINYPHAHIPVDIESYYGGGSIQIKEAVAKVARGFGVLERYAHLLSST